MKILLDTHIFLWALSEPEKLTHHQRQEIISPANQVYLSSISIAEIMIKKTLNKLNINFDPMEEANVSGIEVLDYTGSDALLLGCLPFHHRDPFDRMLITQSLSRKIRIMTNDGHFKNYACKLVEA